MLTERYSFSLVVDIEPMDWDDFINWTDGCRTMYEKEAKARKAAGG